MKSGRFLAFGAGVALAACGALPASNPVEVAPDPALPLLSDVDIPEDAGSVTLAAPPRQTGGLFSRLLGNTPTSNPPDVDAALSETLDDTDSAEGTEVADTAPASPRRGLFGLFNASAGSSDPGAATVDNAIPAGTVMAFGEIAPTCGISRREMGTEIAKASGYVIYDSAANTTAPRPHYITGFNDGCARQFTAALVLMGDVGTHEIVRYSQTRVDLPYSKTDNAYEAIKKSFCGAGFAEPCGNRLERLAKGTTFVTAYERFGAGPVWAEFLLHDGKVAASGLEGG